MKAGILKSLALTTLATGALIAAMPGQAEARVIVNLNTGPTYQQQCNGYTRTFIDGYGYQRTATGTACLQPNGQWVVVSETMDPMYYGGGYQQRVIYRDAPSYYVRPSYVYINDRNTHWRHDNDRHDDRHDNRGGRGHH